MASGHVELYRSRQRTQLLGVEARLFTTTRAALSSRSLGYWVFFFTRDTQPSQAAMQRRHTYPQTGLPEPHYVQLNSARYAPEPAALKQPTLPALSSGCLPGRLFAFSVPVSVAV